MIKRLTHRQVHVPVPCEIYFALLLEAERTRRSMGDIVLSFAGEGLSRLRRTPRSEADEQLEVSA
jgi:hypothetical protein